MSKPLEVSEKMKHYIQEGAAVTEKSLAEYIKRMFNETPDLPDERNFVVDTMIVSSIFRILRGRSMCFAVEDKIEFYKEILDSIFELLVKAATNEFKLKKEHDGVYNTDPDPTEA